MITSMTGFAEKRVEHKHFSAHITIKTLNHRYFDWSYHGVGIGDLEDRLRKITKSSIHRGKVDVFLDINFLDSSMFELYFNKTLLRKIKESLKDIDEDIKNRMNISLENLFNIPHLIELKSRDFSDKEIKFIENAFKSTLEKLLKERKKEGERLQGEIEKHLNVIKEEVAQIEKAAEKQPLMIRKKFLERIKRLKGEVEISDEKIAEETALYAQKFDLDEEIERLKSHLQYFSYLFKDPQKEPVGKKLDFASQEILRETNTISSKSQEIEIVKRCLAIKGELESIRQQIRNLE